MAPTAKRKIDLSVEGSADVSPILRDYESLHAKTKALVGENQKLRETLRDIKDVGAGVAMKAAAQTGSMIARHYTAPFRASTIFAETMCCLFDNVATF
jgi:hypothetical protein